MAADAQAPAPGPVLPPARMAHLALRTAKYQAMVDFYQKFLGAHVSFSQPGLSFLSYDSEHHRVVIMEEPEVKPRDHTVSGMHHMAFAFSSLEDLLRAYQQRKAHGFVPLWCVNHGPTTSMYYKDPDGNLLETTLDNYDTPEEANAFLAGPLFAENPVGVDYDPEELMKRVLNGESEKELKTRKEIGPRALHTTPAGIWN